MNSIRLIEKLFDVKINHKGHRHLIYTGEINEAKLTAIITANPEIVEWQDPAIPSIDGEFYLILKESADDERSADCFTFNPATGEFGIC